MSEAIAFPRGHAILASLAGSPRDVVSVTLGGQ